MYEKLKFKVDELFKNAPNTKSAYEIKEEFMANLIDKYDDLIADGKSENDAVNIAIAGVGDIGSIIRELNEKESNNKDEDEKAEKQREKSATLIAIAIALYAISLAGEGVFKAIFGFHHGVGDGIMLMIDAVATAILIYNYISSPKRKHGYR